MTSKLAPCNECLEPEARFKLRISHESDDEERGKKKERSAGYECGQRKREIALRALALNTRKMSNRISPAQNG